MEKPVSLLHKEQYRPLRLLGWTRSLDRYAPLIFPWYLYLIERIKEPHLRFWQFEGVTIGTRDLTRIVLTELQRRRAKIRRS